MENDSEYLLNIGLKENNIKPIGIVMETLTKGKRQ